MLKTRPARIALLICLLCIVALITVMVVKAVEASGYHKTLVHEAGDALPPASHFLKDPDGEATYVTDPDSLNVNKPGLLDIQIKYRGRIVDVSLEIRDTRAPSADPVALDILPGETAELQDFITNIQDATPVHVQFGLSPDYSRINTQSVTVVLVDDGDNSATFATTLRISKLRPSITVEANADGSQLDPKALLKDGVESDDVAWADRQPDLALPGSYPVEVLVDGQIFDSEVIVVDTTAPAGTAVDVEAWVGDALTADMFVADIRDATPVTVSFETPPDMSVEGTQPVRVLLTDASGNRTALDVSLTLAKDTEPPVIYGAKKYTLYIGQTATYKKDVIAIDNRDGDVEIKVDSSSVNPRVEGDYTAVYSATDAAGNSTSIDVTVVVKQRTVTMDELNELADQVLAEITSEDKSLYLKAWDIYSYVNLRLTYTGTSDKTDWMLEARRGIVDGVGDCFTYYSMSNLLLNRIGMQTLSVERASKPGEARHFWHMVNWGEGWYHFDACIHIPKLESFMLTTAQIDAFSARVGKDNYYYRFDRDNYPASETKIVNDISVVGPY